MSASNVESIIKMWNEWCPYRKSSEKTKIEQIVQPRIPDVLSLIQYIDSLDSYQLYNVRCECIGILTMCEEMYQDTKYEVIYKLIGETICKVLIDTQLDCLFTNK
jgi:hypothetical protein